MKNKNILIPFIMAFANSLCVSFAMCVINIGFQGPFLIELFKSFVIGLIITTPISYTLPILLNKIFN